MSGFKTDLKLLACQHNDQTWSAIHGDEILTSEAVEQLGEGSLLMLNLSNNRQIQDKPELAGPELVRQLQKLSRLSEKLKDQREEIDQWKQSLTYQSQELSRRELEMETRLERLEEMEQELRQIDNYRQEIKSSREQVAKEQQKIEHFKNNFGDIVNLSSDQIQAFRQWASTLVFHNNGQDLGKPIGDALTAINQQQRLFDRYWQQLTEQRSHLEQQQQKLQEKELELKIRKDELLLTQQSLTEARVQFEVQKTILANKQELLRELNLTLQANEDLQTTINRLAIGAGDGVNDHRLDRAALENMPLGELEAIVKQLQEDLEKLVRFVNDQEEELTLQCESVREVEARLAIANGYDRLAIESELEEEKERKGMLDETLVGQRRTLRERQEILLEYLRVLRRRQGIMDIEERLTAVNWELIINQIQQIRQGNEQNTQTLKGEINLLQKNLEQIQEMITQLDRQHQQKVEAIRQDEENWFESTATTQQLQSRLQIFEEILQPLQDKLDEIKPNFEEIETLFSPLIS